MFRLACQSGQLTENFQAQSPTAQLPVKKTEIAPSLQSIQNFKAIRNY